MTDLPPTPPARDPQPLLDLARERLWTGKVAILTGAGISAESGIATYRDHDVQVQTNPLWDEVDPREMATPRAFRKNRNRVWRWYISRARSMRAAEPNAGHELIAEIMWANPQAQLFTQNVDGLHERTGVQARRLHGSAQHYRCRCGHRAMIPELDTMRQPWPYCEACGSSRTRPDVVWFGEGLPEAVLRDAYHAFAQADLKLVVGTSAVVQPVASLPLVGEGLIVEVNPERTALTEYVDLLVRGPASRGLAVLTG